MIDHYDTEDWDSEAEEEEADRQRKAEPAPTISQAEFLTWRSPRQVILHPTRLDNPLWHWLVRARWDAYNANNFYSGPSSSIAGPMWCFDRFGKSETLVSDGQIFHIGGEHEDYYDPDFFIYNDVIVINPNGDIAIFAYPVEDFPPTDFHSATLVGIDIYIIGRLGYGETRQVGTTPVYKLNINSMLIGEVDTFGEPPGWIYNHTALLADDGHSLLISGGERWIADNVPTTENIDDWLFDTVNGEWRRLTQRNWQRWTIRRVDRKRSRMFDVRQELWHRDNAHLGLQSYWKFDDIPDFAALEKLYCFGNDVHLPTELEFNVFVVIIDALTVRFKEDDFWIEALVEGQLSINRLKELQTKTLELVERLEGCACIVEAVESK